MKKIYILGSINTDLVINTPYIPNKGETLIGSGFFTARGGKGANQGVAAARSGGQVKFLGAVGNDLFGHEALESLNKEGINTSHVHQLDDVPTGTAMIIVCEGDNRIILDAGANHKVTNMDVDNFLNRADKGDIFLAQLENPIEVVGYALRKAKEKKLITFLNPAPANKEIIPYLKYVDVLVPNEGECELLGGVEQLKKLIPTLIVTLGDKGFRYIDKSMDCNFPCPKVKAIDTTAAGDTFLGATIAKYSKDGNLIAAACYGSLAASIACTRKGAQPSIPKEEEVQSFKQ